MFLKSFDKKTCLPLKNGYCNQLRRINLMNQISRFVIWICSRFNRKQIEMIVKELSTVLKNRANFPSKPKNAFKEQHPRYRDFYVDKTPPLTDNVKKNPKI